MNRPYRASAKWRTLDTLGYSNARWLLGCALATRMRVGYSDARRLIRGLDDSVTRRPDGGLHSIGNA
jgi:hypothetical protein